MSKFKIGDIVRNDSQVLRRYGRDLIIDIYEKNGYSWYKVKNLDYTKNEYNHSVRHYDEGYYLCRETLWNNDLKEILDE